MRAVLNEGKERITGRSGGGTFQAGETEGGGRNGTAGRPVRLWWDEQAEGAEADLTGAGARLQELPATDRTLGFILNETEAPEGVSRECCDLAP